MILNELRHIMRASFSNRNCLAFSFTTTRKYSTYVNGKQVSNLEPACYKPGEWSNSLADVVIVIYLFFPYLFLICNNLQTIQSLLVSEYFRFERIHCFIFYYLVPEKRLDCITNFAKGTDNFNICGYIFTEGKSVPI